MFNLFISFIFLGLSIETMKFNLKETRLISVAARTLLFATLMTLTMYFIELYNISKGVVL